METPEEWAQRIIKERNFLSDTLAETRTLLTEVAEQADTDRAAVLVLQARIMELENEVARRDGIIVRQRLTIQEQGKMTTSLRDQVAFLKDKIADLHHQLVESREDHASSGNG